MKTIFSKILVFATVLTIGAGSAVYAENGNSKAINEKATEVFCSKISSLSSKVNQLVSEKMNKLELRRGERDKKLGEKRTEINQKLQDSREKWDRNRAEQYAKLEEKADTDAKKQALLNFKSAIDGAVADRRAAINSAQDAFRTGIDQLLTSRGIKADQIVGEYRAEIEEVIKKVETECASGASSAGVIQDAKKVLKTARERYTSGRQEMEKLGEQIKVLVDTRKTAFEKAKSDFMSVMDKAKADLKIAFGVLSSPTPNPTITPSASAQP